MSLKKLIFFGVILGMVALKTSFASAQETSWVESVRADLTEMFSTLDKSKVPTGYLSDYSVNMIDFTAFDGLSLIDSNYVDLPVFADMLYSINSARVSSNTDSLAVDNIVNSLYAGPDTLKLGLLAYNYNYIVANALTDNLITYVGNKVYDVYENGIWKNPYGTASLFGLTTGMGEYVWNDPVLVFSSSSFLQNLGVTTLYFDAGDGQGYRLIQVGSTQNLYYSSEGQKELKMKAILPGGGYLESHSLINVITRPSEPTSFIDPEIDTLAVSPVIWGEHSYTAKVYIKCAEGHNNKIIKPFIFAEGFDPWKILKLFKPDKYDRSGSNTITEKYSDLQGVLTNGGYDFIYIDWESYLADIRANGALLMSIISQVNSEKASNGSTERNVVMGESMGGIIACYALREMELEGISHETDYFISNDAPYLGANIPLGAQYIFQQLIDIYCSYPSIFTTATNLFSFQEKVQAIFELANGMSIKQLLTGIVQTSGTETFFGTSDHAFIENLIKTNGLPQGDADYPIENIALSEGGYFNTSGGIRPYLYNPGDKLFHLNASAQTTALDGLLCHLVLRLFGDDHTIIVGRRAIKTTVDVYPYDSYGQKLAEYNIFFIKKFLWINKSYTIRSRSYYAPSSGIIYDHIPGSYYSLASLNLPAQNGSCNFYVIKANYDYTIADRVVFVPTASSLLATDYNRDYYNISPPIPFVDTPFQNIVVADTSRFHTDIDSPTYTTFLNNVFSAKISGPTYAVTGSSYSISNYNDSDVTLTWSVSDPGVASINNSGVLTVVADTSKVIDILRSGSAFGKTYCKKKTVLVGLPNQFLSSSLDSGQYTISSQCVYRNQEDILSKVVLEGSVFYKWGIKYDDGPLIWSNPSSSNNYVIDASNTATLINVYLKLIDTNGNESAVVSLTIKKPDPLLINIIRIFYWEPNDSYYYIYNFSDVNNVSDGYVRLVLKKNPQSNEIMIPEYYSLTPAGFSLETRSDIITSQGINYYIFNFEESQLIQHTLARLLRNYTLGDTQYLSLRFYTEDDELIQICLIPIIHTFMAPPHA